MSPQTFVSAAQLNAQSFTTSCTDYVDPSYSANSIYTENTVFDQKCLGTWNSWTRDYTFNGSMEGVTSFVFIPGTTTYTGHTPTSCWPTN